MKAMKQKIKKIPWFSILGILFVLLLFFGPSNSFELPDEGKYATITHEKYNFSIDYPTKWRVSLYNDSGKEFKGEDRRIKLELYVTQRRPFYIYIRQRSMKNPTLQDLRKWGSNVMDADHHTNYGEASSDEINGHHVLRQRINWRSYTTEYVYFVRSNDMIIISMQVKQDEYDENIDDFNSIIESFRPFK